MTAYQGRIGADFTLALDAARGDPTGLTVTAFMVRSNMSSVFRPARGAAPIPMMVAQRAAAGRFPAGWNVTLPAAQTADLAPGFYGVDAVVTGPGGSIDVTLRTALVEFTVAAIPTPAP